MHPPSPVQSEPGAQKSEIVHIIRDVRNIRLDDDHETAAPTPRDQMTPHPDTLLPALQVAHLQPTLENEVLPHLSQGIRNLKLSDYGPIPSASSETPRTLSSLAYSQHLQDVFESSGSPPSSSGNRPSLTPFDQVYQLETPPPSNSETELTPVPQSLQSYTPGPSRPHPRPLPSLPSSHHRRRLRLGLAPHHRDPSNPTGVNAQHPVGYPFYITQLSTHLGERDNCYPLWYQILAYWFPQHEGFEIYNEWQPPSYDGIQPNIFNPTVASIAVVYGRSPVVLLQIHDFYSVVSDFVSPPLPSSTPRSPSCSSTRRRPSGRSSLPSPSSSSHRSTSLSSHPYLSRPLLPYQTDSSPPPSPSVNISEKEKAAMKVGAERLFDDAALFSSLPTLCVIATMGKYWSGFSRSTDMTSGDARVMLGGFEWFGNWDSEAGAVGKSSFEVMGRCFEAAKRNCRAVRRERD